MPIHAPVGGVFGVEIGVAGNFLYFFPLGMQQPGIDV